MIVQFVSYAQNMEDVMLYRALKQVEHGFYIDAGAWHPVIDSVTKAFYDRGWRGINIEPTEENYHLLKQYRPGDVNLHVALGANSGETEFYEIGQSGLSTTDKSYALRASEAGRPLRRICIPCTTLSAVCRDQLVETIHFLKIDVEGAEKEVLEGFDFAVRPWIIVIEANEPNSTRDASHQWESLLTAHDYKCAYYDGLNRFYIAAEHPELHRSFAVPPNVFDDYVRYTEVLWQEKAAAVHRSLEAGAARVAELERLNQEGQRELGRLRDLNDGLQRILVERDAALRDLEQVLAGERSRSESLNAQLQEICASRSWRITAPLRATKDGLLRSARPLIRAMIRHDHLRRLGGRLLAGQPDLKARLYRFAEPETDKTASSIVPEQPADYGAAGDLTEPARAVYFALRKLHGENH